MRLRNEKLGINRTLAAVLAVGSVSCSKKDSAADVSAHLENRKLHQHRQPPRVCRPGQSIRSETCKRRQSRRSQRISRKNRTRRKEKAPALAGTLSTVETALDKVGSAVGDKTQEAKDAVSDAANSIGSAASQAGEAVADKAGELKDKAADKAGELKGQSCRQASAGSKCNLRRQLQRGAER